MMLRLWCNMFYIVNIVIFKKEIVRWKVVLNFLKKYLMLNSHKKKYQMIRVEGNLNNLFYNVKKSYM